MTLWKLAVAYFIPTLILASLLCGHFISELGLLQKWFHGDNEIRQIVSLPPATTLSRNSNPEKAAAMASQLTNVGSKRTNEKTFDDSNGNGDQNGDLNKDQIRYANAYDDSLKTAFRTAKAYFNDALACTKTGRLEEAVQAYQQALVHKRDFPHALLNLGVIHYRRKDWPKARETFEAASRLDNNYEKACFNLALTYGKLGEFDKAVQVAGQALALNNRKAATYNLLGLMHTLQGDYEAAVSVYKQGLAVDAKDAELISNLSLAYQKMKQLKLAEENLL